MSEPGDGAGSATVVGQCGQRNGGRHEHDAVERADTEGAGPVERGPFTGREVVEAQAPSTRSGRGVPQLAEVGTVPRSEALHSHLHEST